jgi:hypothetical protein
MSPRTRASLASCALGLLVALPALPWVWGACVRASWATLGRDQGIFQYIAWAVSHGAKAYRDVRDVNGPLVLLVHQVMLGLGGADEHRFRILDLLFVGGTAAFAGACLPSLTSSRGAWRAASMALASLAVVMAQYLSYGFWDTAQRESFFDGFVVVSMGLQWLAQARMRDVREGAGPTGPDRADRVALLLLAGAGAASVAPWLGKPTYAVFTLGQLVALIAERPRPAPGRALSRARRLAVAAFALGGALGAAVPLLYLVVYGDVAAWAHITFVDVPTMYRFIWPRTASAILEVYRSATLLAVIPSVAVVALVALGRMPRAAISLATLPLGGLASAMAQAKGFPYHFQPASLGSALALLALADHAYTETKGPRLRTLAAAVAIGLGGRAGLIASRAPFPAPASTDLGYRESEAGLEPYVRVDYFPYALREAAAEIDRHVRPDEKVQVYGMDPYLLFLAKRQGATPYIYAYDVNVDAALHGSFDEGGRVPDDDERARIRAMRDAHEADMLARLEKSPPAAFVFVGRSPLMTYDDAVRDFEEHCPATYAWVAAHYHEAADYDGIRVWLKGE